MDRNDSGSFSSDNSDVERDFAPLLQPTVMSHHVVTRWCRPHSPTPNLSTRFYLSNHVAFPYQTTPQPGTARPKSSCAMGSTAKPSTCGAPAASSPSCCSSCSRPPHAHQKTPSSPAGACCRSAKFVAAVRSCCFLLPSSAGLAFPSLPAKSVATTPPPTKQVPSSTPNNPTPKP